MRRILERIQNSEFLTFSEVLRLKVAIVTIFLTALILLNIPVLSFSTFAINPNLFMQVVLVLLIVLTILFMIVNFNRLAMHTSIFTIVILTAYYTYSQDHFYAYIMFFVTLTIIIFYQDIVTYLLYGGSITAYGVYYIYDKGASIIGTNSLDQNISMQTYVIVLTGFFLVFLIQFLISDNIYEKMNNEWVRMKKILGKYQEFSFRHLTEMDEEQDIQSLYRNAKFQQTVSELSVFINEFFEEEAHNITEVVEYYFFLHTQEVDEVIQNKEASIIARRYAAQFEKYLLNQSSELMSILFDFATLFKQTEDFELKRYNYNLDELYTDRINKLLSLAMLYHYLKVEVTQFDKWGNIKEKLTHEQITELFISPEFREFISYEQVNFYLDNEDLFKEYL